MKRTILIYGLLLAALTGLLQFLEYRFFLHDLSMEIYLGILALFFTALGIWVGLKWTKGRLNSSANPKPKFNTATATDPLSVLPENHNITQRELEVLQLIARGHSNQEIADQLFVSLNTVKTHSSNLFSKLDVKRRTQAVRKAKDIGLI